MRWRNKKIMDQKNKTEISKIKARGCLIATAVFAFVGSFFWYIGAMMAVVMSFDGGVSISMILMDVIGLAAPLVFQIFPVLLSWWNYRAGDYRKTIFYLKINWWSIGIIFISFFSLYLWAAIRIIFFSHTP